MARVEEEAEEEGGARGTPSSWFGFFLLKVVARLSPSLALKRFAVDAVVDPGSGCFLDITFVRRKSV